VTRITDAGDSHPTLAMIHWNNVRK
jgi:hypothetical protein